ncbi:hypothetical protein BASA82_000827 [Batrachochytrium salamandrivorans]|nr:hypothetical protein BASA82_000827 [Batrachochytrium salamandrivorans]
MKLISFVALSFLAITVSAYPHQNPNERDLEEPQIDLVHSTQEPPSATTQDLEEPQGATTQSTQQYQSSIVYILRQRYRESLKEEMDKLETSYKIDQAYPLDDSLSLDGYGLPCFMDLI